MNMSFGNDNQQRGRIALLEEQVAELESIEEKHRKLNGELRIEITALRAHVGVLTGALRIAGDALHFMVSKAFMVGLEGTSQWDEMAGGADIHGAINAVGRALSATPPDAVKEDKP